MASTTQENYYSRSQQNIFDVCTQKYGTMDELFNFLSDNDFDLDTILQTGQKCIIDINEGDNIVKKFVTTNNYIFANQSEGVISQETKGSGSYSKAYSKAYN